MTGNNQSGPETTVTAQMSRLASELREQGAAPSRDLWDDIDRRISASEQQQLRPSAGRWTTGRQLVATAATVAVLLVLGLWNLQQPTGPGIVADETADAVALESEKSDMRVIDEALAELNLALSENPNNRSLICLANMLHQSRGRLLRQNANSL